MVHFKLNLSKIRHLFLCNLKWYNFLPHPLPFIRCCVSLTILNIRSKSVQRGIQSSVQREAINRSIWWHCSELAAVRVKWKLHIVKRQQRSDFTPWYSGGTVAVYDAVGKGVRQLKVFRSHPPPMAALSLDQFMWMMMMMMVVMILMRLMMILMRLMMIVMIYIPGLACLCAACPSPLLLVPEPRLRSFAK